jgi:hypothetical protein
VRQRRTSAREQRREPLQELRWPARILRFAVLSSNHSARSTSGNSRVWPERGGHSSVKVLLWSAAAPASCASAQACTRLPPFCSTVPSGTRLPCATMPVSSRSSRFAAASGSSPSASSPFGIDHAPSSFLAQNGPPGWTRKTSSPCPGRTRCSKRPALWRAPMAAFPRRHARAFSRAARPPAARASRCRP